MSSYKVQLLNSNETFEVRPGQLILDAAIEQGVSIPYSCRNGTCRTCILQVVSGIVQQEDSHFCTISPQELEVNRRLVCMSTCHSHVVLEKLPPRRKRNKEGLS